MKILKYISDLFNFNKQIDNNKIKTGVDGEYICDFYIAGLHYENRIDKIKKINERTRITLVPEPDNLYDEHAVGVYADGIGKIGYVPAFLTFKVKDYIADGQYDMENTIDVRPGNEVVYIKIIRDTKPISYRERRTKSNYEKRLEQQNKMEFNKLESSAILTIKQILKDNDKSLEGVTFTKRYTYLEVIKFTKIISLKLNGKLLYALVDKDYITDLPTSPGNKSEIGYKRIDLNNFSNLNKLADYILMNYKNSDYEEHNYLNFKDGDN